METYEKKIRKRVQEVEESCLAPSLKSSTIKKKEKEMFSKKPLEDAFQLFERDEVDMKVMRGLWADEIPFNVMRKPRSVKMVRPISNGPKGYKPPFSERLNCTFGPLSFQKLWLWTPN